MSGLSAHQKKRVRFAVDSMPLPQRRQAARLAQEAMALQARGRFGLNVGGAARVRVVIRMLSLSPAPQCFLDLEAAAMRELADMLGPPQTPWDDWKDAARQLWGATRKLIRYLAGGEA